MCHHATSTVASYIMLHTMCIHIVFQRSPTAEHACTLLATSPALIIALGPGPPRTAMHRQLPNHPRTPGPHVIIP